MIVVTSTGGMYPTPNLAQPDAVAQSILAAWDAEQVLHVPGTSNRLMTAILQRLPRGVTRSLTARMFAR